jgi:hypothetical protein
MRAAVRLLAIAASFGLCVAASGARLPDDRTFTLDGHVSGDGETGGVPGWDATMDTPWGIDGAMYDPINDEYIVYDGLSTPPLPVNIVAEFVYDPTQTPNTTWYDSQGNQVGTGNWN